jgi:hypothetical protein
MSIDQSQAEVKQWLAEAKDPRWKRPYPELTDLPMQEVLKYKVGGKERTLTFQGAGMTLGFLRHPTDQIYIITDITIPCPDCGTLL